MAPNYQRLGDSENLKPPTAPRSGRWKGIIFSVIASCFVMWMGAVFGILSQRRSWDSSNGGSGHQYPGEKVSWQPCGSVDGHPLECFNLTVPMDHFDTSKSKDKTFRIPVIRLRGGEHATQNLLLNPGGPGGSGLRLITRRGTQLRGVVGDGLHIVSFDPRGVGGSVPRALCYPDNEIKAKLSAVRSKEAVHDSAEMYAWAKGFVRACKDTMGELGGYITTPQTAADMNSILDAVGQQDMYYWGFSYGTTLGQTYAQLFPKRSKRIIIDGVSNSFHWYGRDFDSIHYTDTENAFMGIFRQCIKEKENCALSSFGDSAEDLHKVVMDLGERLKEQPMSVYVNNTAWGQLTYENIFFNGILPALYRPLKWYALTKNLAKLINGNATDAWLAYAQHEAFDMGDDSSDFVFNNDAHSGPNYWTQDRKEFLEGTVVSFVNISMFGPSENLDYYTKQQWIVPKTREFTPKSTVATAEPMLLVSMTIDPICPLTSAKNAQQVFQDSRLVEIKGVGHCSVSVVSICAANYIRDYLHRGIVPNERHVTCEVDRPYFIDADHEDVLTRRSLRGSEQLEKDGIYRAQLALAGDWQWMVRRNGFPMPL
ncbi:hypothetical protein COCMIDRAFT_10248 [Bipolaris oryzae ATCC 44560]|uniref:AB hydrolase-1 domain-containing protein n=1 Tax=Bipolaris oryzae ATCC 44560 TaxID=930090 RepID=W6YVZ9_COCMI|nr:uncharacterized protein COCMIDRAFT_10248 [Bipolaris oryzae ATCC 44560]EUC39704.1 hypothetical protein COCMIDRAFT_10248 [Bipolaris oryzae ATCC 44560]